MYGIVGLSRFWFWFQLRAVKVEACSVACASLEAGTVGTPATDGPPRQSGSLPTYIKAAARPDFQFFFLFFSLDQKVYPELPRPSLVSHGDELPDLIYEVALCRVIFSLKGSLLPRYFLGRRCQRLDTFTATLCEVFCLE